MAFPAYRVIHSPLQYPEFITVLTVYNAVVTTGTICLNIQKLLYAHMLYSRDSQNKHYFHEQN
jgi:hypothetical protein